ncbi:MAG: hypothetical protein K2H99_01400, partial [Paramuribaculum sp.]|nr:hypothetical protein [Paramuribaculum sp.]
AVQYDYDIACSTQNYIILPTMQNFPSGSLVELQKLSEWQLAKSSPDEIKMFGRDDQMRR